MGNKTRISTTIISAMMIGAVLLAPNTILPSVNALPLAPYADEVDVIAYDTNGNEYESLYVPDSSSSTGYEWYGIYTPNGGSPHSTQFDVAYPCDSYTNRQTLGVQFLGNGQWKMLFLDQANVEKSVTITTDGSVIDTGSSILNYGTNVSIDSITNNGANLVVQYHHISPVCPTTPK